MMRLLPALTGATLALLGAALLPAPAHSAEGPIRRFALVVGANDGGSERVLLRYAHDDAASFLDVVTELGGVRAEDAILLTEPDAEDFKRALYTLSRRVADAPEARTEVLFYYSGHSDEGGLLLRGERIPYPSIREGLAGVPADVRIAVVDSCASGALTRTKGGTLTAPFLLDESRVVTGHAYLTSASADEAAQEADRLLGSFFTHALVTGLRGAADTSGDGRVTLSEAYTFAYDETLRRTENTRFGPQHATRQMDLTGTGDLVMTDLSAVDAGLELAAELSGRLSVREGQGRLVAEVTKPAGRAMALGLGAGRYRVVLEGTDGRLYEGRVTLIRGERTRLELGDLSVMERVAAVARGDMEEVAAEADLERRGVAAGLFPVRTDASVAAAFTAVGAYVGELRGPAVTMGINLAEGDARSLQVGMVGNAAGGDSASQVSMMANYAGLDLNGVQLTMGSNIVEQRMHGLQASVGVNLVGRDVRGAQLAVGGNIAVGAVSGFQGSVGVNWAHGPLRGSQIGGLNRAAASSRGNQLGGANLVGNDFHGSQLGLLNIGRDLTGAQVGLVNVAREVSGSQVGLLNIAKRQDGASVGLVQIVEEGQLHGEVWASDTFPANAGVQFGGRRVFSQVHVGVDPRGVGSLHASAGVGVRLQRLAERPEPGEAPDRDGRLWGEVDVSGGSLLQRDRSEADLLVSLRGSVGWQLERHLSPQVGLALHGFVDLDASGDDSVRSLSFPDGLRGEARGAVWPSVFVGVQF